MKPDRRRRTFLLAVPLVAVGLTLAPDASAARSLEEYRYFRALSIDLAVIHVNEYEPTDWPDVATRLSVWPELELEQDLGSARVYRLNWDPVAVPAGMSR